MVGQFALGLYLGSGSVGSSYGTAGSLVIVLVWIYYSAQIFLFGAEFTQVYAKKYGSRVEPASNAEFVTEEARAEQGIGHDETPSSAETEGKGKRRRRRSRMQTSPWFK